MSYVTLQEENCHIALVRIKFILTSAMWQFWQFKCMPGTKPWGTAIRFKCPFSYGQSIRNHTTVMVYFRIFYFISFLFYFILFTRLFRSPPLCSFTGVSWASSSYRSNGLRSLHSQLDPKRMDLCGRFGVDLHSDSGTKDFIITAGWGRWD